MDFNLLLCRVYVRIYQVDSFYVVRIEISRIMVRGVVCIYNLLHLLFSLLCSYDFHLLYTVAILFLGVQAPTVLPLVQLLQNSVQKIKDSLYYNFVRDSTGHQNKHVILLCSQLWTYAQELRKYIIPTSACKVNGFVQTFCLTPVLQHSQLFTIKFYVRFYCLIIFKSHTFFLVTKRVCNSKQKKM